MDIEQLAHSYALCAVVLTTISRFRKAGYQAIDRICDYYYSLEERPVIAKVEPGYLKPLLPCERQSSSSNMTIALIKL